MKQTKKGQVGLIAGLIFGIASLVIGVIIAFVIVQTLTSSNLITQDSSTVTVVNETGAWLNATGYTLSAYNTSTSGFVITAIWGAQGGEYNVTIPTTNGTIDTSGILTNATVVTNNDVSVSYTLTYTRNSNFGDSSSRLSGNYSQAIDNVSGKIPTVLLVAAIVLILGILALLVGAWQRMRVGSSGI